MADDLPSLWAHQLKAIEKFRSTECGALFFDCGTGKSATTIHILRHKYNTEKRILRTLILCPVIVVKNWRNEFKIHSKIPQNKITCLSGSGKERVKLFERATVKDPNHIFVLNYEGLLIKDLYNLITLWGPEVIVCDESHRIKEIKAQRTKKILQLSRGSRFRYILSGSPVLNSLMDVFSQFLFLDRGATFGQNFFVFRAVYFYDKNAGIPKQRYFPAWQVKPTSLQEINRRIDAMSVKVRKEDCLDLPPFIRQEIKVAMTPEQRRVYLEMKSDFIAFINDKSCVATLAITKALRLQQIASGYIKTTDDREIEFDKIPKKEALKELLEELTPGHKVLVWAVWKQNYKQIREVCEDLNIGYVEIHGEISQKQKENSVEKLNNDPTIRVLIGHPGSAGLGINLIAASYSIFYSRTFALEHSIQSESRNYRSGSEIHEKITRIDLITENSIDELVAEKLIKKQEISLSILEELKHE